MISLKQVRQSPPSNPDRIFVQATFSGNYGAPAGAGDALNLLPYQAGVNPGGITDPNNLGFIGPNGPGPLDVPPGIFSENLGGYYIEITPGTTLQNTMVRVYNPGGAELVQNAAYPGAVTGGSAVFEILLPLM